MDEIIDPKIAGDEPLAEAPKPKPATKGKQSKAKKATKAAKPAKAPALPWTFPKNTLEDAIKIAQAVEEQNAGNPMRPEILAKAVGFNSMADWRFLDLLRSANQYGLVTGSGKISPVALTEIGQDVVAPSTPSARPKALQEDLPPRGGLPARRGVLSRQAPSRGRVLREQPFSRVLHPP